MYEELFTGRSVQLRPDEDQAELLRAAKAGDTDASWRLLQTYAPLMRKTVRSMTRTGATAEEVDDRRGTAVESVLQAIKEVDEHRLESFGGLVQLLLRRNLMDGSRDSGVAMVVPDTQRRAYFETLEAAGGDFDQAVEIAVSSGRFRRSTFLAVHAAIDATSLERESTGASRSAQADDAGGSQADRVEEAQPLWQQSDPTEAAEARMLATQALQRLGDERDLMKQIVALRYGLDGDEPMSDAAIARRFGLHTSTVQALRQRALVKMRESLGLAADGSEVEQ